MSELLRCSIVRRAAEESRLPWLAALVALAVAGAASILLGKLFLFLSPDRAAASITAFSVYAVAAFIAGAYAAQKLERPLTDAHRQAAAIGAWAGPAMLATDQRAPILLLAALLLAPAVARLFPAEGPAQDERTIFGPLGASDGGLVRTLAAALALQLSAVAVGDGRFVLSALLIGAAIVAAGRVASRRRSSPPEPRFAALLIGAAIFGFLATVPLGGGGAGDSLGPRATPKAQTAPKTDGDYEGLILTPKNLSTVLLAPPPPFSLTKGSSPSAKKDPLEVPFFGIYWVFLYPREDPPPGAFRGEGDPESMNLRSLDGRPMRAEARQNFGRIIDLRCCSRIQVKTRNSDRYPGSVRMELLTRDSRNPKLPAISLGSQEIRSTRKRPFPPEAAAVKETVDYAIPPGAPPFDEAIVRFHLERHRSRRTAKIAIEAFVFVPRV